MYNEKEDVKPTVVPSGNNPKVSFDMVQGEEKLRRVVMQVFKDVVPKTAENFIELCKGTKKKKQAKENDKKAYGGLFGKVSMYNEKEDVKPTVVPSGNNPKVSFDMVQGEEKLGRVVMQVFKDVVPK